MVFKKNFTPWNKGKKGLQVAWNKGKKLGTFEDMYGEEKAKEIKKKKSIFMKKNSPSKRPEVKKKISESHKKEGNPAWKGGKKSFYYNESRRVMEKHQGRKLNPKEIVHHIDGNIKNNQIKNLFLLPSQMKHLKVHALTNKFKKAQKEALLLQKCQN